jgi:hypothetical protein
MTLSEEIYITHIIRNVKRPHGYFIALFWGLSWFQSGVEIYTDIIFQ